MSKKKKKQTPVPEEPVKGKGKEEETVKALDEKAPEESGKEAENVPEEKRKEKKPVSPIRRRLKVFRNLILKLVLFSAVLYVLMFHIIGVTRMPSSDMHPRIEAGDAVLFYRLSKTFKAQDVVALALPEEELEKLAEENPYAEMEYEPAKKSGNRIVRKITDTLNRFDRFVKEKLGRKCPEDGSATFICRVVAVAGDTVEITGDSLVVNGNAMVEPNIFYPTSEYAGFVEYPVKLNRGEVFVLADWRQGGMDSRFFGVVKEEDILGTVITIIRRSNI